MSMQELELEAQQYQSAAVEMCHRLNVDPFEPLHPGDPPQWFRYAVRMAEHEVMVQVMRVFGRHV